MPVLQNLYQVYKLPSSFIVENNLKIDNYTRKRAIQDGNLVSVGDNMVFYKIRDYYGDTRSHKEIFDAVQNLRTTLRICKREGKILEGHIVNQQIQDILFVKDIIVVVCEKKSEYLKIGTKGFEINGVRYTRLCAGAGNLRRNNAIYVNEKLYPYLYEVFMCGLADKLKEAVLPKLGAYFALSFSSVLWVRTPRVCVIKDFETTLPNQNVDFICRKEELDEEGKPRTKHYIEKRVMDLTLNSADGQGLVDPEFSKLWAEDMQLDYIPSSFVVRSSFVKGNLVPFDFKAYAAEHGIDKIKDRWGVEYPLNEIDVLLSESQFKEYKEYSSWQEYLYYFNKYKLRWGVARYNKKHDDEYVLANYQYIQALTLSKEDIHGLIQPTIDWIKNICSGDDLYSLLFMFGGKSEDVTYERMYSSAQSTFMKAIVKNNEMLKDAHVQRKIYKNIVECINRAKIGKIWVRGNYQFMISDPIAQCQSALGLPVKGEVPAEHVWSNFWNERGVSGEVDCCRSPMIDTSEHNPTVLYKSDETEKWYQYIKSGLVYSIYDVATFKHSDSDFDGDIALSTNNEYFLKGAHRGESIITYEKGIARKEEISQKNFVKKDLMGFGTAVGSLSNTATIIYAMIGIFNKPEQAPQRQELYTRIKLLREYVGQEIDRAKLGIKQQKLPVEWRKHTKVNEDDTDEVKAEKYKHNSMVICKKPYFFRYLYPELNKKFKQFENGYNIVSKDMFGIKFKKLLAKPDKTEAEKMLVRRYQKYSPLIVSNCTMNILCKEFENVDFDIKFGKSNANLLNLYQNEGFEVDTKIVAKFRNAYRKYNNKKTVHVLDDVFENKDEDDIKSIYNLVLDTAKQEIQEEIFGFGLKPKEMLFYVGQLAKEYANFNWSFVWDIMDSIVLEGVEQGKSYAPVRSEDGEEYLGEKFVLKEVVKKAEGEVFTNVE